jgi:hypothetical protein
MVFHWKRRLAWFVRWFHIYCSMFCLAAMIFFGVTGFTLNHPDWFYGGYEDRNSLKGSLDAQMVQGEPEKIDKLGVVEALRSGGVERGRLADFQIDDNQCVVTFKGPGYSADAFIERESGNFEIQIVRMGLVAVLNDLHKGRDSGPQWSLLIDISAIATTIVALSGVVLLLYIKRRLLPGLIVGLAGLGGMLLVWKLWVS